MQKTVRSIAASFGYSLEELGDSLDKAACCGWGGHIYMVDEKYTLSIADRRISESDSPYIVYCANCRDVFAQRGKETVHILDLVFALNGFDSPAPDISLKRTNRKHLKKTLIKAFAPQRESDEQFESEEENRMRLKYTAETKASMNAQLILAEDIEAVIEEAEKTGVKVLTAQGQFAAHLKKGFITYWAIYQQYPDDSSDQADFLVLSAYAHRMSIME